MSAGPWELPDGWRWVTLGEVAEINPRGDKPSDTADISFVGMAELDAESGTARPRETRPFSEVSKGYTIFRNRDILVAKITPCWENGKIGEAILDHDYGVGSTEFHSVRTSKEIDSNYLLHFLRQPNIRATGELRMTGSGGQRRVPSKYLSDLAIPLPPLSEQRRITGILDKASELKKQSEIAIQKGSHLEFSLFNLLFSETPSRAECLSKIATVSSGITKGRRTTEATKPVPYLAVSNVQAGHLRLDNIKNIEATESEINKYALRDGDLVLTEGGDPDKLGRGTVWRSEIPVCLHQNHVFRVRIPDDSSVLTEYLTSFMASHTARSYFLRSAKQTTGIASINMRQLKALPVPVPPIEEQIEFMRIKQKIGRHQNELEKRNRDLKDLIASLQSCAFRGEL